MNYLYWAEWNLPTSTSDDPAFVIRQTDPPAGYGAEVLSGLGTWRTSFSLIDFFCGHRCHDVERITHERAMEIAELHYRRGSIPAIPDDLRRD